LLSVPGFGPVLACDVPRQHRRKPERVRHRGQTRRGGRAGTGAL
jgi:hypothetical protein